LCCVIEWNYNIDLGILKFKDKRFKRTNKNVQQIIFQFLNEKINKLKKEKSYS